MPQGDGLQIKAHKIILSSASFVFNQILRQHRHENALILLHDLEFEDLKHILEFIYTGKCEVRKVDLSRFLSCGTALGVKGLTENIDVEDEIDLEVEKNQQQVSKKTPSVKIIEENIEEDVVDYIEENIKEILEKNVKENIAKHRDAKENSREKLLT